ncbi:Transcriptional regulator PadR-like family protein [uncultured archaeon]|nr:Transcriptional regulator PadR-like family protein [uncultured archaeon]
MAQSQAAGHAVRPHQQLTGGKKPSKRGKILGLFLLWRLMRKDLYGYLIIDELNNTGMFAAKQSTIYSVLSNMEKAGLVKSKQRFVDNRPRRIYTITPQGKRFYEDIRKNRIKDKLKEFIKDLAR